MTANFLGVERSLKGQRWVARLQDTRNAITIAQRLDVPELLARVMAARGVEPDQAEEFLTPTLRRLMPQPQAFRDMEKGAEALADAIFLQKSIGVITDYDVDGVTSGALLQRFLNAVGSSAIIHIPDRITEGYGPSEKAVGELKEKGIEVLLTLDCGVLSHDPLAHAASLGLQTIIIDHHQAPLELPEAYAVINPNRQDDTSGQGHLCAAGVVMIMIAATNKVLRARGHYNEARPEPNMLQWLELVALATVCDVVPLKGLNRAYVTQGLKVMARRENKGCAALMDQVNLRKAPDVYTLGFMMGPRLNAAGRVGRASDALNLLLEEDLGEARNQAHKLDELNRKRQAIEITAVEEAILQAELELGKQKNPHAIVAGGEHWHPGVVGLVAARLKERFKLPSFALSLNKHTGKATGSGRSIAGVDIGKAVRAALEIDLIIKGGGHAMAAGLTLEINRLSEFREFIETVLSAEVDEVASAALEVDGALSAGGATIELLELLEQAGPYGSHHPAPIFVFPSHRVIYADPVGSDHIRCTIAGPDGSKVKAIAFRAMGTDMGELLLSERSQPLHLAGRLVLDDWNGKRSVGFHIEDIAIPS